MIKYPSESKILNKLDNSICNGICVFSFHCQALVLVFFCSGLYISSLMVSDLKPKNTRSITTKHPPTPLC